jgi:hypothetical protein
VVINIRHQELPQLTVLFNNSNQELPQLAVLFKNSNQDALKDNRHG